jgi:hypothetical protein
VVSGAGRPLAPAFAELGREPVWPVLLPFHGQPSFLAVSRRLTLACHHVARQEEGGAGRECCASLLLHSTARQLRMSLVSLVAFTRLIAGRLRRFSFSAAAH